MGSTTLTSQPATMKAALIVLSALTCTCLARPQEAVVYADEPPVYTYTYAVADDYSGSNFGADEQRDGPVASGSYYVNLPDSRVQKVTYSVNADGGYIAEVSYEGTAVFPEVKPYVPPAAATA